MLGLATHNVLEVIHSGTSGVLFTYLILLSPL